MAISFGALDISDWHENQTEIEIMLLPVYPVDEPIGLAGQFASLWRRLVAGPVNDDWLSPEERALVREFAAAGIASEDAGHAFRMKQLVKPWFSSPLHELVCGLIGSLAREIGAEAFIVKGPVLCRQGLRERDHSGDVDIWMPESGIVRLKQAMAAWGWVDGGDLWEQYGLGHSVTLRPRLWGCEVDAHRRMTGLGVSDQAAFEILSHHCETVNFSGVDVHVLNVEAHAVVASLHVMRPEPGRERSHAAISRATTMLRLAGPGSKLVAEQIGAFDALYEAFSAAFPDESFRQPSSTFREQWGLHSAKSRTQMYVWAAKTLPWRRRCAFFWWAFWPSESFVQGSDRFSGARSKNRFLARLRRASRGVKAVWAGRKRGSAQKR